MLIEDLRKRSLAQPLAPLMFFHSRTFVFLLCQASNEPTVIWVLRKCCTKGAGEYSSVFTALKPFSICAILAEKKLSALYPCLSSAEDRDPRSGLGLILD